jgi:Signal peptidase, peptidase S26
VTALVATGLACLPAAAWAKDSLADVYRVEGTSMEPALHHGDYVLVRKCEAGGALWDALRGTALLLLPWFFSLGGGGSGDDGADDGSTLDSTEGVRSDQRTVDATDRARIVRHEMQAGVIATNAPMARLYDSPPTALPGHVVVYKDPSCYGGPTTKQLAIKRVVAVGGQLLQLSSPPSSSDPTLDWEGSGRRRSATTTAVVPPYFLHVEGTGLVCRGCDCVCSILVVRSSQAHTPPCPLSVYASLFGRRQPRQQPGQPAAGTDQQGPAGGRGGGCGVAAVVVGQVGAGPFSFSTANAR